jgi:hypothetical protein
MGHFGLEWTVAGFGDFSGNPGETDMLMRAVSGPVAGVFDVYDISNNTITSAASWGRSDWSGRSAALAPIRRPRPRPLRALCSRRRWRHSAGARPSAARQAPSSAVPTRRSIHF